MRKFVLKFNEIDRTSLSQVGGKGANLGEMTQAGFPVPQGFCVTTLAYQSFVETSAKMHDFFTQLDHMQADNLTEIRALGQQIRDHLESLPIPDDVRMAVVKAWRATGVGKAYAIRSSATAEDLPGASFAGQQETYLNVLGEKQLLLAVRRCWASLFTDRAISYRAKNGFDHRQVFLSVVVQEMVFPDVSGIMFTADPITGNRTITAIDASFGLGEALVSGLVSADLYQVKGRQIVEKKISEKKIAIYSVPEGGTVTKGLPIEQQQAQALPDERIIELSKLGRTIEAHYQTEQDIEWCLAGGAFYIVQSRPITSLYPMPQMADDQLHVLVSLGHQQMMTDAMSPMGMSVLRTLFPFAKAGNTSSESPAVLEAGSHLFVDPTELLHLKPAKRILPRALRAVDERIGSGIEEVIRRPEFQRPADKRVQRATFRVARTAVRKALPGFFIKDTSAAREDLNRFIEHLVAENERSLHEVTGAERIERLQENVGSLIVSFIQRLVPFMLSGMASKLLAEALIRRWLGNDERIPLLNKSLVGNVTSELGLMIGDLADIARKYPEVAKYLQTANDDTFIDGLAQVEGGKTFGQAFEQFMRRYGMRCPGEIDIANPRWRECPTLLVPAIISHMHTVAPGEHREKFAQGEQEAENAAQGILSDVRKTAGGAFKVRILSRAIRNYRNFAGVREHPKFILIQHFGIYKQVLLEEARTLVRKGKLADELDVFYLSLRELQSVVEERFSGDLARLITERKHQLQRDQKLTPPRVMTSEGEIITGRTRDVDAPEGALVGTPVSAGVVEGYAKVVLRPEEAQLNAGEIMIAPFTDPGWTPLFHSAKALVMEVGGMMTHGAVVAREYGIPAVVGIDGATHLIKDGDHIRVDGSQGFVQVLKTVRP